MDPEHAAAEFDIEARAAQAPPLPVMASIFIPLTSLAGVYGMNFRHMPELDWPWAYPAFWIVIVVIAGALLYWFRRRGWLRGD